MKRRLNCEGYELDVFLACTNPAMTGENRGLKEREANFNNSKVVRLIGHLQKDLWHQENLIPPGLKLAFQLVHTRPAFFIKTGTPADRAVQVQYNYHIFSLRFISQFKELSTELVTSHMDIVMNKNRNYIIHHTKLTLKTLNFPSAGTSYTFDNVFKGKLPDRIALAMVANAAANGCYNEKAFNFQNCGLNYIAVSANSDLISPILLEPNFGTNDYLREYLSAMESMVNEPGPSTRAITPTQWASEHKIYVLTVKPGPSGRLHSKQLNCDIRQEMKFATALTATGTMLLLSEEPTTLEIAQFKHELI